MFGLRLAKVTSRLSQPIKAFLGNARRWLFSCFGTLRLKIMPIKLTDDQFLQTLNSFNSLSDFTTYLKSRTNPSFFIDPTKKYEIIVAIQNNFPASIQSTIVEADRICDCIFDLLGSGPIHVAYKPTNPINNCIDWHYDFKSGRRWSLRHYKFYNVSELDKHSDIKVPWELARFQHLSTLGKAYWYTDDEKYTQEFVREIKNWIDKNPVDLGVNWICSMEAAIRAINWIWGYYFFKDSKEITPDFLVEFLKSLLIHGRHIMENLEYGKITSNHYLSDIAGLLYLGIIFPEFKEAKKWREFGVKELIKEMEKQVYEDGVDFEASTSYHRLVLELFFSSALLCRINHIKLPKKFWDRLEKMFDFVLYYLKPNGKAPQIGDNDNGRLHILKQRDVLDHSYLLTMGALLFNNSEYKIKRFDFDEEALWFFGQDAYEQYNKLAYRNPSLNSNAFESGGVYIMRNNHFYVIVNCGFNNRNSKAAHAHNDELSFELNIGGQDFIIDPGAYSYTGDYRSRNLFRSSRGHNTVVVDGIEINSFDEQEIFKMKNEAKAKVLKWMINEDYDLLEAEHYGYLKLREPVVHRRRLFFNRKQSILKIEDFMEGNGLHTYEIFFHFPSVPIVSDENDSLCFRTNSSEDKNISIVPEIKDGLKVELKSGWISPSYGIKLKAPYICYSKTARAPTRFTFSISLCSPLPIT